MINKMLVLSVVFVTLVATLAAAAMSISLVLAIVPGPCSQCAKDFAPGQEKKVTSDTDFESKSAKSYAPGQEKAGIEPGPCSSCNGASEFAPGQEKVEIIGPE